MSTVRVASSHNIGSTPRTTSSKRVTDDVSSFTIGLRSALVCALLSEAHAIAAIATIRVVANVSVATRRRRVRTAAERRAKYGFVRMVSVSYCPAPLPQCAELQGPDLSRGP